MNRGPWVIERIAKKHDRKSFDCGKPALNDYLLRYARQNEERHASRTYVAIEHGFCRVVGYYALASGSIAFDDVPQDLRRGIGKYPVPVVVLARLAVDTACKGRGLGGCLLADALGRVLDVSEQIGVRAVVVNALDIEARAFYVHMGFLEMTDDPLHLFLPVETILRGREHNVQP